MRSLSDYEIKSTGEKHTNFCCLHITKLQLLGKLSPLVHFVYFFLLAWIFGIIQQNTQNDLTKHEVSKNLNI